MDYYDQIEDYIKNALSEAERNAFEAAMESDDQLKAAVENHGVAMDVVGSIFESEVRKVIDSEELKIGNDEEEVESGEGIVESGKLKVESDEGLEVKSGGKDEAKVRRMNWIRWASVAVVVFVLGWWGVNLGQNKQYEKRHDEVMLVINKPAYSRTKRGDEKAVDLADRAVEAFNLNNRDVARELFLKLQENSEFEDLSWKYLGYINLYDRNYKESIKYFKRTKQAGFEVDDANQMLAYNYYILGNSSELNKLLDGNSDLIVPSKR